MFTTLAPPLGLGLADRQHCIANCWTVCIWVYWNFILSYRGVQMENVVWMCSLKGCTVTKQWIKHSKTNKKKNRFDDVKYNAQLSQQSNGYYVFSWKFMITRGGERHRDRERTKAKQSLALLSLGSAGQYNSLERKATLSQSTYALNLPRPQNIPTQHPLCTHEPEVPRWSSIGQVRL